MYSASKYKFVLKSKISGFYNVIGAPVCVFKIDRERARVKERLVVCR